MLLQVGEKHQEHSPTVVLPRLKKWGNIVSSALGMPCTWVRDCVLYDWGATNQS